MTGPQSSWTTPHRRLMNPGSLNAIGVNITPTHTSLNRPVHLNSVATLSPPPASSMLTTQAAKRPDGLTRASYSSYKRPPLHGTRKRQNTVESSTFRQQVCSHEDGYREEQVEALRYKLRMMGTSSVIMSLFLRTPHTLSRHSRRSTTPLLTTVPARPLLPVLYGLLGRMDNSISQTSSPS
jgi:hypothetical protein